MTSCWVKNQILYHHLKSRLKIFLHSNAERIPRENKHFRLDLYMIKQVKLNRLCTFLPPFSGWQSPGGCQFIQGQVETGGKHHPSHKAGLPTRSQLSGFLQDVTVTGTSAQLRCQAASYDVIFLNVLHFSKSSYYVHTGISVFLTNAL